MAAPLDPSRPVRWGILGAGKIAATVGADIVGSAHSQVVAVGSRDAARAAALATKLGAPRSFGSYRDLVDDPEVDVVYIATTHGQHRDHAMLALAADKPVLVEKAFTLNARQGREVVAAARSRGLFCMEAMWMRLNPLIRQAVEIARSGRIGEIVAVRADMSRRFAYSPTHRLFDLEVGGGALLDLGVYPVTFTWDLLGAPATIAAHGRLSPTGSDVVAAMTLAYSSGSIAQLLTSAVSERPDGGVVLGTDGWLRLEPHLHPPDRLVVSTPGGIDTITADASPGNGYERQVAEVERCLREGRTESATVPLDDTIAILEILDEIRAQIGVVYAADA